MLQQMRRAQSWMIKGVLWAVVLAFIVTIFYAWGVRSSPTPTSSEVATVLGSRIGIQEFQRERERLLRLYRALLGGQEDLEARFNFREMALQQLATRLLVQRLAEQEGIQVSEQELYDHIAAMPAFQTEGRFDPARYQAVLRSQVPPVSPRQFEEEQRQFLLQQKLFQLLEAAAQVSDADIEEAYRRDHERLTVRYVTLVPSLFAEQVEVSEADVQAYYEAHRERYRLPEQRRIRYMVLAPERFTAQVQVSPRDIEDYYALHQEAFRQPERVHARHILLRLPPDASAEQEAEVRARAEKILAQLRAGADFAELARKYSEDPATADKGGDLGTFARGEMVQAFEEAAFSLPVGAISDLVRTPYGFHILRVEARHPGGLKPLDAVRAEVEQRVRQEKAQEAVEALADELLAHLEVAPAQFTAVAEQHNLPVTTTPFVPATGRLADVKAPDLVRRAFALEGEAVDAVAGSDGTYYLFQVVERRPATVPPLADLQEQVRADVQQQRATELARQTAEAWAEKVRAGTALSELAASLQLRVVESEPFTRLDPIPELGENPAFRRVAFGLQPGEVGVAHDGSRTFVIEVVARQPADMAALAQQREAYRTRLLAAARQRLRQAFEAFLQAQYRTLREQGEIVVNPQYVF
ncbi:MAG: peptidylprolyl isomerase [Candidatus Tectimicrobiota bacterium]|nr:MAG: peptidylprolyl isomerase [Candidatus Tectomicrobia bacterium]